MTKTTELNMTRLDSKIFRNSQNSQKCHKKTTRRAISSDTEIRSITTGRGIQTSKSDTSSNSNTPYNTGFHTLTSPFGGREGVESISQTSMAKSRAIALRGDRQLRICPRSLRSTSSSCEVLETYPHSLGPTATSPQSFPGHSQ